MVTERLCGLSRRNTPTINRMSRSSPQGGEAITVLWFPNSGLGQCSHLKPMKTIPEIEHLTPFHSSIQGSPVGCRTAVCPALEERNRRKDRLRVYTPRSIKDVQLPVSSCHKSCTPLSLMRIRVQIVQELAVWSGWSESVNALVRL